MNLKKKLNIVESVGFEGWKSFLDIFDLFKTDQIEIINKSFSSSYYGSKDLNILSTWSTYDKCIFIELTKTSLTVCVWDGDILKGLPTKKRFTVSFSTPENLNLFEKYIEREFNNYCRDLYEEEKIIEAEKRIEQIKKEILTKP